VLHNEELAIRIGEVIAHLRQDRMPEARKDASLSLKSVHERGILLELGAFESDGATETLVDGKINFTHAALAYRLDDKVAALDHRIRGDLFHELC